MEDNAQKFSWDEDWTATTNDMDEFLEPTATEVSDEEPVTVELEDKPKEEAAEPVVTPKVEEESVTKEPEESEEDTPKEEQPETEELVATDAYKEMVAGLKLQGFIKEDSDNLDDVLEQLEESVLTNIEQGVDNVFKTLHQSLGEEGTQLLKHLKSGGTFSDFMKVYTSTNLESFDVNTETGQEQFLRYYYSKIEGESPEDVEDRIDYLQSSDKLSSVASRYYGKLQEKRKEEREALITRQTQLDAERKELERTRKTELRKKILGVQEVSDFKFSPTEKREIFDFLTNPVEQVNGRYVPKFVAEINRYQQEEPDKLALIVKLMRNGFDFSQIKTKEKTRVARTLKKGLQAETESKPKQNQHPDDDAAVWEKYFS